MYHSTGQGWRRRSCNASGQHRILKKRKARHHLTCNISHGYPTPLVRTPLHADLIEHRALQCRCPAQPRFELERVQCPGQLLMVSQLCKFPNIVAFPNVYVPVTTVTLPLSDIKSNTLCLLYSSASLGIGSEAPDPLALILLMLLMPAMVAVVVGSLKNGDDKNLGKDLLTVHI